MKALYEIVISNDFTFTTIRKKNLDEQLAKTH